MGNAHSNFNCNKQIKGQEDKARGGSSKKDLMSFHTEVARQNDT